MNNYSIEATKNTPSISFDLNNGVLEIKGRSIPEDSVGFYKPMFNALEAYSLNPRSTTNVIIRLEYFNSSSSACVLSLFKKLEKINNDKCTVTVNWLYEENDEDILMAGKNYQEIIKLPFKIAMVKD